MSRPIAFAAALAAVVSLGAGVASTAAASPGNERALQASPIARLPFPERGYVLSVGERPSLAARDVVVRENGVVVQGVRVDPVSASGLRFGVVLALDASESMTGGPASAAVDAARAFVAHKSPSEEIGIVAFNGDVAVLQGMTRDTTALRRTLSRPPALAYGTRIHDALARSLALLRAARLSSGSVVLLSDGADIGSVRSLDEAVEAAAEQQVRVFTVGLRSGAYDAAPLQAIAERTGGSYAEARSDRELAAIYEALGTQLAGEYLVRYRSPARPMAQVDVRIDVRGVGSAAGAYVAPTPSLLEPYQRSPLSRFLLSAGSPIVLSLLVALLIAAILLLLGRRPGSRVVARVERFASESTAERRDAAVAPSSRPSPRKQYADGWWAQLERDLELARMSATPRQVVGASVAATVAITVVAFAVGAPILGLFGLAAPLVARAMIRRRVRAIRDEFADQFPGSLQVLASALRAGHSFNGALGVVVDHAREPARSELARVLQDDRLGVLPEDAIRKLARRMQNRDIEQVALLAELQRTAGGNAAEILDTVVRTIRERAEIRRLVRTLTAQGRMARWILTALPAFLAAFLWLVHPESMANFVTSSGGQVALLTATAMVAAGSLLIRKIIDIEV